MHLYCQNIIFIYIYKHLHFKKNFIQNSLYTMVGDLQKLSLNYRVFLGKTNIAIVAQHKKSVIKKITYKGHTKKCY
jgi:hypothetical protein